MRAGGCAVQQGLASEAAAVVKQAVVLAKRRAHAQVTPLHVASSMLAAPAGLLRIACQRSHSHPLQCKALELCFNVALNRLPASSPTNHSLYPSISNALVAAFKRAQAHQRRGSVENQQQQQQTLLPVKIEIEQLVISILDDPSVSRVMREAGFSSTQVKGNVEKAVSLELCSRSSSPPPPGNKSIKDNKSSVALTLRQPSSPPPINLNERKTRCRTSAEATTDDDVGIIIETLLMNRRRSLVIVGESISTIESTVKHLMDRVDGGGVPEGLREVKFVSIPPLHSFCNLEMNLVRHKMGELACLAKSLAGKGVVLYLGDLNRISECNLNLEQEGSFSSCSSVEHMIMELGRLVCRIGEEAAGRIWLMGIATFQTYMRCRNGYCSLESVWGLHPVTIPSNTLGLSLISHSEARNGRSAEMSGSSHLLITSEEVNLLTCCHDCSSKFEDEARDLLGGICTTDDSTTLSSLQLPPWLQDQSRRLCKNDQYRDSVGKLRMKWNSYCNSAHNQSACRERTLITFGSASPSSSSSSDRLLQNPNNNTQKSHNLKEFNARNLNMLCDALEEKVPWQREIIPEIAGTVLECRSGMLKRKDSNGVKEETWLLFLGPDDHAQTKLKISRELARIVFGSYSCFTSIGVKTLIDSNGLIEWLGHEVSTDPHRVFLVEDFEQADNPTRIAMSRAIESGRIGASENGGEVGFLDAIIVFTCKRLNATSELQEIKIPLDLNLSCDEDDDMNSSGEHCDLGLFEDIVDRRVVFGRSIL
ncbi:protein SMAX1-LIKE 3-like isoform X2 [Andrographis paniculata]|uniref:protein SMAX1-LIKE 3-like isoform X2 n=1 Tax=Andrographis paniculata TaxID=175694 RepID=UPI0021E850E1|nr:protein SMAX1-LIKE 3-like isoform X2 [Andrographis paniculata]